MSRIRKSSVKAEFVGILSLNQKCLVPTYPTVQSLHLNFLCPIREQDGQASGGNDFGSDDWIFTIREKDPKKLQNGEGQSGALDQVTDVEWPGPAVFYL